ncbi:MAG TPA: 30S ribosomal protein S6 [Pseudobdellovibrionaceae bacterium]|jgi:small subunit ribosomal protein S6|nr:30S ribosomal protein S6 [Pseudobdellovibrionaceae bacterium]
MAGTQVKRYYEAVVVLHPDTPLEEQKEIFRKNKAIIEGQGGSVFSLETWGKRNLANMVNKLKKAIYFHSVFEADAQSIAEIERVLRINEKVLRFIHTRLDERESMAKHLETFKRGLQESMAREKEREAKAQARRAAAAANAAANA